MKIFSLQSKTSLVVWSVVLGLIFYLASMLVTYQASSPQYCSPGPSGDILCSNMMAAPKHLQGLPFGIVNGYGDALFPGQSKLIVLGINALMNLDIIAVTDLIFWFLAVLITLSLIRYFKYKNQYDKTIR